MSARIAAFLIWAAVAACSAFWGLRLLVTPHAAPSQVQPVSMAGSQRGDILRLFALPAQPTGPTGPTEPALAARFKLMGVMAPKAAERGHEHGVALIAVDDKPPRAYRVGARLDNTLVLQSVAARSAVIGPAGGAPAVQLDLPLPTPPATGSLPPPPADGFLTYGPGPQATGAAAGFPGSNRAGAPALQSPPPVTPPPITATPMQQMPASAQNVPLQPPGHSSADGIPTTPPPGQISVPTDDPSNRR